MSSETRKRIAFYGGSFDPVHIGHLEVARRLEDEFGLDEFVFIPAYHAPHKRENKPASPFHRFAMLAAVTDLEEDLSISTIELDDPEEPYSIQTLGKLTKQFPDTDLFFVIGADSWEEITTWRRWEEVLTIVNIIVVTRPGFEIGFDHVMEAIRERIVDLRKRETGDGRQETESRSQKSEVGSQKSEVRGEGSDELRRSDRMIAPGEAEGVTRGEETGQGWEPRSGDMNDEPEVVKYSQSPALSPQSSHSIFITDSVFVDVSATEIRRMVREGLEGWEEMVPSAAARHIVKYRLYR